MEGFYTAGDGSQLFYRVDDFTNAWEESEAVLFVHGLAESTEVWKHWVPYFSRHFRVVRFDIRGFGQSTPMPADHRWSLQELASDMTGLLSHLGIAKANVIGAKSGGTIAMKFAADHPDKTLRLGLTTSPILGPGAVVGAFIKTIESSGVPAWARETMPGRFGTSLPPAAIEWWTKLMGATPKSTLQSYLRWVPGVNITEDVKKIRCPTLLFEGNEGPLHNLDDVKAWLKTIQRSELKIIDCDGWHPGGARPDECAPAIAEFFRRTTP